MSRHPWQDSHDSTCDGTAETSTSTNLFSAHRSNLPSAGSHYDVSTVVRDGLLFQNAKHRVGAGPEDICSSQDTDGCKEVSWLRVILLTVRLALLKLSDNFLTLTRPAQEFCNTCVFFRCSDKDQDPQLFILSPGYIGTYISGSSGKITRFDGTKNNWKEKNLFQRYLDESYVGTKRTR